MDGRLGVSASDCVGVDAVAVGDEMGRRFHPAVSQLAQSRVPCRCHRLGCDAGERVEGEHFDVGVVVGPASSRIASRRSCGARDVVGSIHRGEQAVAECGLFSTSGGAMPCGRRFERGPRRVELSERPQHAAEMDPGERRHACVAGGFGLVDREFEGGGAGVVVAGLALGSSEAGSLVRLCLQEAETSRAFPRHGRCGATASSKRCCRRASSPSIASRRTCSHGSSTCLQPVLDVIAASTLRSLVAGGDRGSGGEEPVRGLIPRPVQSGVQRAAAVGELQRVAELAVVRHDVGEVVAAARLQVDVVDRVGELGGCGDVVAGEFEVDRSTLRAIRRAAERWRARRWRGGVAGRVECGQDSLRASAVAEHDPRPSEPVDDARARAADRGSCVHAKAASMLARSARAKARCSAWSLLRTPCVDDRGGLGEPCRVRGRARARSCRRRPSLRARTRGRCRAAGSERASTHRRRRRSPANGWRGDRRRRSPRPPARRALRGRTRPRRAVRRRRRWRGPTARAGRRGTTARSSTGSSP